MALLDQVVLAVREAGSVIESVRAAGFAVTSKGAAGPVTDADRRADALLRARLLDLHPAGWLSEETADSPARREQATLWVVDPLDGTREFVQGLPEYTVAVALVDAEGPLLGVVCNPATGDLFAAERGAGTRRNGARVRVQEGETCLASRSEVRRGEFEAFGDWAVRPVGSIAYKLALVAAGDAAMTLSRGPKHEWDVCAGALLVAEAGGLATDVFGGSLRYNQPFPKTRGILAGAPEAYARALALVGRTGASDRMREFTDH